MALKAQKREITGKKVKTLRTKAQIPASVYGAGRNPAINVVVDRKELLTAIKENGYSKVFELQIEGESKPVNVVFKELQTDAVRGEMVHASFHQIAMDKKITAEIPVNFNGLSMAVKNNLGLLVTALDKINVSCLPGDLPSSIEIDISKLDNVGDVISLDKITLPKGVEVGHGTPHDAVLIYISAPQKIEEEKAATTTVEGAPVEGAEGAEGAPAAGAEGEKKEEGKKEEKKKK